MLKTQLIPQTIMLLSCNYLSVYWSICWKIHDNISEKSYQIWDFCMFWFWIVKIRVFCNFFPPSHYRFTQKIIDKFIDIENKGWLQLQYGDIDGAFWLVCTPQWRRYFILWWSQSVQVRWPQMCFRKVLRGCWAEGIKLDKHFRCKPWSGSPPVRVRQGFSLPETLISNHGGSSGSRPGDQKPVPSVTQNHVHVVLQAVGGGLEAEVLQDQVRRGRDGRGLQAEGGSVVRGGSLLGAALLLPGKTPKSPLEPWRRCCWLNVELHSQSCIYPLLKLLLARYSNLGRPAHWHTCLSPLVAGCSNHHKPLHVSRWAKLENLSQRWRLSLKAVLIAPTYTKVTLVLIRYFIVKCHDWVWSLHFITSIRWEHWYPGYLPPSRSFILRLLLEKSNIFTSTSVCSHATGHNLQAITFFFFLQIHIDDKKNWFENGSNLLKRRANK